MDPGPMGPQPGEPGPMGPQPGKPDPMGIKPLEREGSSDYSASS